MHRNQVHLPVEGVVDRVVRVHGARRVVRVVARRVVHARPVGVAVGLACVWDLPVDHPVGVSCKCFREADGFRAGNVDAIF